MTRDLSSWQVTSRAQRSLFLSPGARGPRRPASPGRPGRYGVGWPGHLLFTATDERDWDAVAAAFADRAALDCTSLSGGEPTVLSGRQIAQAWSATLGGLDATHHLTGNYLIDVEADRATARFAATATHRRAGGTAMRCGRSAPAITPSCAAPAAAG
jgi:hypothetical protein